MITTFSLKYPSSLSITMLGVLSPFQYDYMRVSNNNNMNILGTRKRMILDFIVFMRENVVSTSIPLNARKVSLRFPEINGFKLFRLIYYYKQ